MTHQTEQFLEGKMQREVLCSVWVCLFSVRDISHAEQNDCVHRAGESEEEAESCDEELAWHKAEVRYLTSKHMHLTMIVACAERE